MKRLAVLASGSGTNLQALLDAAESGAMTAEIAVVVSDRAEASALCRAASAGVATICLPLRDRHGWGARERYDCRLGGVVAAFDPDLVVLAGWMLILTPSFLDRFPGRVVNVHPALLPDDGGPAVATSRGPLPALRGSHAVRDALARGLPLTGATVHYVTTTVDAGPVILRQEVPIYPGDDETRLHARIKRAEHCLLPRAVTMALAALPTREH